MHGWFRQLHENGTYGEGTMKRLLGIVAVVSAFVFATPVGATSFSTDQSDYPPPGVGLGCRAENEDRS
jgi:hypothetical protein